VIENAREHPLPCSKWWHCPFECLKGAGLPSLASSPPRGVQRQLGEEMKLGNRAALVAF
jgi:hypothetical protein